MDKVEKQFPLRLTLKTWEQLQELSKLYDGNITQTVRQAIKSFYKEKQEELREIEGD